MIDMKEKGMSRGEFDNVCRAVGGWAKLVDENAKDKDTLALLKWLDESQQADKLFENQQLFRQPHCAQRQTGHRRLLPRGVGEVGVRQTVHLSLQEPRGPTDLRIRP